MAFMAPLLLTMYTYLPHCSFLLTFSCLSFKVFFAVYLLCFLPMTITRPMLVHDMSTSLPQVLD